MAGSVNKVILIGNLGRDPEIRTFQNGGKVANLRIATSEQWKDRNTGERKERTEWHSVAIMSEGLVNVVERFLKNYFLHVRTIADLADIFILHFEEQIRPAGTDRDVE